MPTYGERFLTPIPRPKLKHLGHAVYKKNLAVALVLTAIGGLLVRFLLCDRRKKIIENYYINYDPEAHFRRLVEAHQISALIQIGEDEVDVTEKPPKPSKFCAKGKY